MSNFGYIIFQDKIELIFDDLVQDIKISDRSLYDKIYDILSSTSDKKESLVRELLENTPVKKVCNALINDESIRISNDKVYIDGVEVTNSIGRLIIECANESNIDNINLLSKFIRNIRENPNKDIINDICDFMSKSFVDGSFSITEEGHVIGYKKVRSTYKDIHSNTYLNLPGSVVMMEREDVCGDRDIACAPGLHFCSYSYLESFGSSGPNDKILILSINPKDIVSVPYDYNCAKGRCCKYTVIGEIGFNEKLDKPVINTKTEPKIKNKNQSFNEKCAFIVDTYNENSNINLQELILSVFTYKELNDLYEEILMLYGNRSYENTQRFLKISKADSLKRFVNDFENETGHTLSRSDIINALYMIAYGHTIKQFIKNHTYDFIYSFFKEWSNIERRKESKMQLMERLFLDGVDVFEKIRAYSE